MSIRTHHPDAKRRIDWWSVGLFAIGSVCLYSVRHGVEGGLDPLFMIPPIVACTVATANLTKWVAPRDVP